MHAMHIPGPGKEIFFSVPRGMHGPYNMFKDTFLEGFGGYLVISGEIFDLKH